MRIEKISKILRMPPTLIVIKVRQKAYDRTRKIRAQLFGTFPSDKQLFSALTLEQNQTTLHRYYKQRTKPKFFVSPRYKNDLIVLVQKQYPDSIRDTVEAADEICNHTFDLLGSGKTYLGQDIDWSCDFKSGTRWEPQYHTEINYINLNDSSDVKVPWELSRFQHLLTLGKAYWYTGDEKYAQEFVNEISDWITKNPPQFGVNWACTMDVAIRVTNWIWGYYFFIDSPSFSENVHLQFLKGILAHGRHIINNLEYGEVTGNHYLSDLVGLVYLGIMFPEFKESKKWLDFGFSQFKLEMDSQINPDGVDFEASIGYHRLVLELFLYVTLLAKLNDIVLPDDFLRRLERMFEFVMYYLKPDGNAPIIGDMDDGRLHILTTDTRERINDHRYLLAIGAVLFKRDDFARATGQFFEEASWFLGKSGFDGFSNLTDKPEIRLQSKAFRQGGFYVLRHDNLYLMCHCGDIGLKGRGGHGHCDQLGFELFAGNQAWIVDPGAYVYTADPKSRNQFRGTRYHNTVVVDGEEQNRFNDIDLFNMRNDSQAKLLEWETNQDFDFFVGEHYGYTRLSEAVIHRRKIILDKKMRTWEITDLLHGQGAHKYEWYFHFDAGITLFQEEKQIRAQGKNQNLLFTYGDQEGFQISVEEGWISKSYGVKEKGQVLRLELEKEVPVEVKFRVEVTNETGV